jgi:FKBP-type peptidyl-prolyl cis-trans isomerase (trigger factor)
MTSSFTSTPDGTISLTLTFPWSEIATAYEHVVSEAIAETEIPGFRKGKAPRATVEAKLDRTQTLSHALQHLLPTAYEQAVTTHQLKPILYPKLQITQAKENQDWQVIATTCQLPQVTLPDYLAEIPKLKITSADTKLSQILDFIAKKAQVTLPAILVTEEVDQRLSSLADNLTNLGLSTQNYLASKKLTLDQLKLQLSQAAQADLTLEFALAKIQADHKHSDRKQTLDFLATLV